MIQDKGITQFFGENLAELLSERIIKIIKNFPMEKYIEAVKNQCGNLSYTGRIKLHADELKKFLPQDFLQAARILVNILGEENKNDRMGEIRKFSFKEAIQRRIKAKATMGEKARHLYK